MSPGRCAARSGRFFASLAVKAPKPVKNTWVATTVVCAAAAVLLLGNSHARQSLWAILMSANQLIAALTLLAASVWLVRNRKPAVLTLVPMAFMLCVSVWSLAILFRQSLAGGDVLRAAATGFLLVLSAVLVMQAALRRRA